MIRFYAKRLERDLKRWHERGWVTAEGYQAILAEQAQGAKLLASTALAAIGAILLGVAAISFVAAHWDAIPRIVRVLALIGALWAAYGGAAYLHERGLPAFAQAATLAGSLFFGAAVLLVTQMYHIDTGDMPGFMFLWMLGAAVAGVLFGSGLTLGCAVVLASAWNFSELPVMPQTVQWHFLPVWAALTGAIAWNRSGLGLYVAAASLATWIICIGPILPSHPYTIVAAIGAAGVAVSAGIVALAKDDLARRIAVRAIPFWMIVCFGGLFPQNIDSSAIIAETALGIVAGAGIGYLMIGEAYPQAQPIAPLLFAYVLSVAFYGLCIVQFHRHSSIQTVVMTAGLTFAILAGALACGVQVRNRSVMWLSYAGLMTETLWLYNDKLGNLIDTSLFFLFAGAAMFGLAFVLMRYGGAGRETEARP